MRKSLLLLVCSFLFGVSLYAQTLDTIKRDSLLLVLKNYELRKREMRQPEIVPADTQKANLLWEISRCEDITNKLEAQKERAMQIKKISQVLNYKKGIANSLFCEAEGSVLNQEYVKAMELYKEALRIREEIKDEKELRWSYWSMGFNYLNQGLLSQSSRWLYKAIKAGEKSSDSVLLSLAYNNLASVHEGAGDLNTAIFYSEKSLSFALSKNRELDYTMVLTSLAWRYILNKNLDKADSALAICYKKAILLKSLLVMSYYYNISSNLMAEKGLYGEAIIRSLKSTDCEDSLNISQNKPYNHSAIADYILKADAKQLAIAGIPGLHKYDEAIQYAQLSLATTVPSNIMQITADNYKFMSTAYEAKGDMVKTLKYFKMSTAIKDSLYSAENSQTIQGLKMQYETEKKEQQIVLLTKDKALHQTEIEKQKTQRNGLAGGCALVLLLAGITYNRYLVKQKANSEIEKTMLHLRDTQEKLIEREKLAHLGKLTADVAKELNTPVMRIKNLNTTNRKLLEIVTDKHANSQNITELKNNLQEINTLGFDADKIVKRVLKETREVKK